MNDPPTQLLSRNRYIDPAWPGVHVVGNAEKSDDEGTTRTAWGKALTVPAESVRALHLRPTAAQAKGAKLPAYVDAMASLHFLAVPYMFLPGLKGSAVLQRITTLQLAYAMEMTEAYDPRKYAWPDKVTPGLLGLRVVGSEASQAVPWANLGLTADRAPSLEFLGCDVGKSPALLELMGSFPKLRHVELYLLGDSDVFGRLPNGLEYAFINSTGPKFAFGHIARLRALKGLFYLWARNEVDCEALAALPELSELKLHSCKKIRGIEALLASKSLRSVEVVNCGRPFSKPVAQRFEARGFDHLNIGFA